MLKRLISLTMLMILMLLASSLSAPAAWAGKLLDEMKVADTCGAIFADKLESCTPFRCTKPSPMAMMFGFPSEDEFKQVPPEHQEKLRAAMAAAEKKLEAMSLKERTALKAKMVSTLEIKGFDAQGRCQTRAGTEDHRLDCSLDADHLRKVSDFARAEEDATHIVIDTESNNPWQQAMNNGQCRTMVKDANGGWMSLDQMNRMSHFEINLSEHGKPVDGHIKILRAADGKVLFDQDVHTGDRQQKINLKPGTFDIEVTSKNKQLQPIWFRGVKLGEANVFEKDVEFHAISGTLKLTLNVNGQAQNMAVYMTDPKSHKWLYLQDPLLGKEPKFYFKSATIPLPQTLSGSYEVFVTPVTQGFKPPKDAKYQNFSLRIRNGETVNKTVDFGTATKAKHQVAKESANTLFILDASGSMWGQIKGKPKITIAKEVMAKLVPELPDNTRLGLIAYGHRRKGDCNDVETLVKLGGDNKQAVLAAVKGLNAKGKTPLSRSVSRAFKMLQREKNSSTIVLVSDGIESCNADPCATVKAAKKYGVQFVLHTIGFGLSKDETDQLQCMANAGAGQYFSANDAQELLESTRKAVQPVGGLKLVATLNGATSDILLRVVDTSTGKVVYQNTLPQPSGNTTPLAEGVYDVYVRPGGVSGATEQKLAALQIKTGETLEKRLSFSKGSLKLSVTLDGTPVRALVHIEDPKTHQWIYQNGTFGSETPITIDLVAGAVDIEVQAEGHPPQRVEGVEILAGKTIEQIIALEAPKTAADASGMEQNTDRPGGGFLRQFNPTAADPALCQQACEEDENCHAWTYVKPNTIQGPAPNCWLKPEVPSAVANSCCVSGVK